MMSHAAVRVLSHSQATRARNVKLICHNAVPFGHQRCASMTISRSCVRACANIRHAPDAPTKSHVKILALLTQPTANATAFLTMTALNARPLIVPLKSQPTVLVWLKIVDHQK